MSRLLKAGKYFSSEKCQSSLIPLHLFCVIPQIFVRTGGFFALHQTLNNEEDILSVTPFARAAVPYLLVCIDRQTVSCLLLQWTSGRFQDAQPLPLAGRAIHVETINTRAENTLLFAAVEGVPSFFVTCHSFLMCLIWITSVSCLFLRVS